MIEMRHNWTPVLNAEAAAMKCANRCGTVWLYGGREPSGECVPAQVGTNFFVQAQAAYRQDWDSRKSYMERMFGTPEEAVRPLEVTGVDTAQARMEEVAAFAHVRDPLPAGYWTQELEPPSVWD